jgi:uncharacterized protein (TIGR00299 family) protein
MKVVYLNCRQGVSGDMMLGALVNLIDGREALEKGLAGLGLECFRLSYPKRRRGGIEARGTFVEVDPRAPHFDRLEEILALLDKADISPEVRKRAKAVFRTLADGEAVAHNVAFGYNRFHEVGAVDAIVDIVGSSLMLELIAPDEVIASPIRTGFGLIKAVHGFLPVPAPATAAILEGVPVFGGDVEGELTTPTGAALVTAFADEFGPIPEITLRKTGYGPGTTDPPGLPNALVIHLGEVGESDGDRIAVLEANVDDMTGEALACAVALLLEEGALDVFTTPVYMKKGRPGVLLTVLAETDRKDEFAELVLRHTSSFGVRFRVEDRRVLPREVVEVNTEYGRGKVKVGRLSDGKVKLHPEYSSAAELAGAANVPFVEVYEALLSAATDELV